MRALVVFESMFGNTQTIAKAVAAGLTPHLDVELLEVSTAPSEIGTDVGLVVVGGPTHAFGMTRASTRADAAKQATEGLVSKGDGIREWLAGLRLPRHVHVAAFDTKVSKPKLPGSAAHAAHRQLRKLGGDAAAKAETFYVEGTTGPLAEGETERARRWGEQLAAKLG
ncbi:flavodoxin family protein [Prauserella muralis]|uniref:Flavodoxin n=1 Tax=Prauserella muralis TaxID=588067 RepID=A0A2V4AGG4_9PSEU|nr:flavodoxin family protein [Prauserella muralis]PXY19014.1 flavodoxin [Prauserella muralis]TWE28907.1 flavodoxin [Prauserella muralis]